MSGISKYCNEICMGWFGGDSNECYCMYCMDGRIENTSGRDTVDSMQKDTGFSSFPCCDYFILKEGEIILIEATQAVDEGGVSKNDMKKHLRKKTKDIIPWDDLTPEKVKEIEPKVYIHFLQEECARKMYSSMAILERMARWYADFADKVENKPIYRFWLVIHGPSKRNIRALNRIKTNLNEIKEAFDENPLDEDPFGEDSLKKTLTKMPGASNEKIVRSVDVIVGEELGNRIREICLISAPQK